MKKNAGKIWGIVQWVLAGTLLLASLGAFSSNVGTGICWALAALLVCPLSRGALAGGLSGGKAGRNRQGEKGSRGRQKQGLASRKSTGTISHVLLGVLAVLFLGIGSNAWTESQGGGQQEIVREEASDEDAQGTPISAVHEALQTAASAETEPASSQGTESGPEAPGSASPGAASESGASQEPQPPQPTVSDMEVHFLDVGQGDATLVKADGHYMLIDAGDNSKGTAVQLYLTKQGVDKLDYMILTHTDADHIGGADVIITKFDIGQIFLGDFKKENSTYEELMDAMEYRSMRYETPEVGTEYQLGNASFTILAPNGTYEDPNNSSIALVLKNGENKFLFSGDCEAEAEGDILSNGLNIDVDVYKAGHHGSSTSSTEAFLDAMTPLYAVISCEENNSYGHPHAETLDHLKARGIQVFRTDEQGTIVAYSDGTEISWSCRPSDSWKPGEVAQDSGPASQAVVPQESQGESAETTQEASLEVQSGSYAVNASNGKIHIVGACPATGNGKSAMKNSVYFDTYEEAEAYSLQIAPGLEKRKCGNCW